MKRYRTNDHQKRIEIDIEDNRTYAQIAFLVDQPTFLNSVEKIRREFKIVKSFNSHDDSQWESQLLALQGISGNVANDDGHYVQLSNLLKKLEFSVCKLRKKYNYPIIFDSVVEQSILFHRVSKFSTVFSSTFTYPPFVQLKSNSSEPEFSDKYEDGEIEFVTAIVINEYSLKEDVLRVFDELLVNQKTTRKQTLPTVGINSEVLNRLDKVLYFRSKPQIKRDRDWFWLGKNGMSSDEILDNWKKRCQSYVKVQEHKDKEECQYCDINKTNTIDQAIKNYRDTLNLLLGEIE